MNKSRKPTLIHFIWKVIHNLHGKSFTDSCLFFFLEMSIGYLGKKTPLAYYLVNIQVTPFLWIIVDTSRVPDWGLFTY